ncbi:MAG: DUF3015 family protein [Bdellovibrionales bacterium]
MSLATLWEVGSQAIRSIFIFAFVLSALPVHAFNKERCGTLFPKSDGTHPPYYSPLYVLTMVPSTASYFSSVGPCSMYGDSGTRTSFIKDAWLPLQVDVSRGDGEYLNAFAELSGCSAHQYEVFATTLHHRFSTLFSRPSDQPEELLNRIDSVLRSEGICVN